MSEEATGKKNYYEEECKSIQEIIDLFEDGNLLNEGKWIFRGQGGYGWELKTSIQRHFENNKIEGKEKIYRESLMIQEFQRYGFKYIKNRPEPTDYLEWLSIIQHWGGKTRLLDFTYNIFTALYFATMENEDSAIWCINLDKLYEKNFKNFSECEGHEKCIEDFFKNNVLYASGWYSLKGIIHYQPLFKNDRMYSQEGLFLIPLGLNDSFENNLCSQLDISDQNYVIKIKIPKEKKIKIIEQFMKLGTTGKSLFPDLNGVADYSNMYMIQRNKNNSDKFIKKLKIQIENDANFYIEKYGYYHEKVADTYLILGKLMRSRVDDELIKELDGENYDDQIIVKYCKNSKEALEKAIEIYERIQNPKAEDNFNYIFACLANGCNYMQIGQHSNEITPKEKKKIFGKANIYLKKAENNYKISGKDDDHSIGIKHNQGKVYYEMSELLGDEHKYKSFLLEQSKVLFDLICKYYKENENPEKNKFFDFRTEAEEFLYYSSYKLMQEDQKNNFKKDTLKKIEGLKDYYKNKDKFAKRCDILLEKINNLHLQDAESSSA